MSKKSPRYYLITGLLSIIPVAATYWIIFHLFHFFSNPGATIVEFIFKDKVPDYVPELTGFLLTVIFIYLIGILVSNVIGKRLYSWFETILAKIPIVNAVYKTIKQITTTLSHPERQAFKKVVYIQYPRKGIWTLTMVTGESIDEGKEKYYHIFVPTTPNPTSGYLLYIPQKHAVETNISVEEGLKIIVSGGLLAPEKNHIPAQNDTN